MIVTIVEKPESTLQRRIIFSTNLCLMFGKRLAARADIFRNNDRKVFVPIHMIAAIKEAD